MKSKPMTRYNKKSLTDFRIVHFLVFGRNEHCGNSNQLKLLPLHLQTLGTQVAVENGNSEV